MRKTADICPTCEQHGVIGGICSGCGLPSDICSCVAIEKEASQEIKVKVVRARGRKFVTIIEGIEKKALARVGKDLKVKLACGGTVKDDQIILQGNHKDKIKKELVALGYSEDLIQVR